MSELAICACSAWISQLLYCTFLVPAPLSLPTKPSQLCLLYISTHH